MIFDSINFKTKCKTKLRLLEKFKSAKEALQSKYVVVYSNQRFNLFKKVVCQIAELKEKGQLTSKELYPCISSHTSRRSFATNLYLQGNFLQLV